MPADAPPPGDDRRTLRGVDPAADAAEPHAAFDRPRRRRPVGRIVIALLLFGGGIGVIAYAYLHRDTTGGVERAGVPVVRPADGPIKVRPEDPGGASIPYQDTLLLNRRESAAGSGAAPKPAEPAIDFAAPARESAASGAGTDRERTPVVPRERPDAVVEAAGPDEPAAEQPATDRGSGSQSAASGYRIQIAALREEAAARAVRKRLRTGYSELFAERNLRIVRADLGDRGVFWRVRAGPFASREAAERVCSRLQAEGQSCFLVAP